MGTVGSKEAEITDASEPGCSENEKYEEYNTESLKQTTNQDLDSCTSQGLQTSPFPLKRKFIGDCFSDLHPSSPKKNCENSLVPPCASGQTPGSLERQRHVRCLFPAKRRNAELSLDVSASKKLKRSFDDSTYDSNVQHDQSETEDSLSNSESTTANASSLTLGTSTAVKYCHNNICLQSFSRLDRFEPQSHLVSLSCKPSGYVSHHRSPWTSDWFTNGPQSGGEAESPPLVLSSCSQEISKTEGDIVAENSPWITERFTSVDTGSSNQLTNSGCSKYGSSNQLTNSRCSKYGSSEQLTSNWFARIQTGCIIRNSSHLCSDSVNAGTADDMPGCSQDHNSNDTLTSQEHTEPDCLSSSYKSPWTAEWFSGNYGVICQQDLPNKDNNNRDSNTTDAAAVEKLSRTNNRLFTVLYGYLTPPFWLRR